jgi:hypothetical protein
MEIARRDPAVNPPESIRRTSFHTQHDSVISAARLTSPPSTWVTFITARALAREGLAAISPTGSWLRLTARGRIYAQVLVQTGASEAEDRPVPEIRQPGAALIYRGAPELRPCGGSAGAPRCHFRGLIAIARRSGSPAPVAPASSAGRPRRRCRISCKPCAAQMSAPARGFFLGDGGERRDGRRQPVGRARGRQVGGLGGSIGGGQRGPHRRINMHVINRIITCIEGRKPEPARKGKMPAG